MKTNKLYIFLTIGITLLCEYGLILATEAFNIDLFHTVTGLLCLTAFLGMPLIVGFGLYILGVKYLK